MRLSWRTRLGLILVAASAVLYLVHYLLFRDVYQVAIYGLSDLAFLPIEVLLVVVIIEQVISNQEKQSKLNKLNMVIGAYFSEVGTALLKAFSSVDPHIDHIRSELIVKGSWTGRDFLEASARLKQYDHSIAFDTRNPSVLHFLQNLRDFLVSKREFLLGLLENPNLLEQESFSEQLWAVFHLAEELAYRTDLAHLPDADYRHLATDSKRAYSALIIEWLKYMEHLRNRYPYLFSLALRTNPFDTTASPIITD